MKCGIQLVLALVVTSLSLQVLGAPQWTFPVVNLDQWRLSGTVTAALANQQTGKVYVGIETTEALRRNLLVFDYSKNGSIVDAPRRFAGHPSTQPPGNTSSIRQLLLDRNRRTLYVLQRTSQTSITPLVAYRLNAAGEPVGVPFIVETGLPLADCQAIALHPTAPRLYAIGRWSDAIATLTLDATGKPTGAPTLTSTGQVGKSTIAVRPDGRKLYLGTRSSTVEVCDIDAGGAVVGKARSFPLLDAVQGTPFFVASSGLYYRSNDGKLRGITLINTGEPKAPGEIVTGIAVQAVAVSAPDRLLVAEPVTFQDAVTKAEVVSGTQIKEIRLQADGTPGAIIRTSPVLNRLTATALGSTPGAVVAVDSLGGGFLGNRFSGLHVCMTLESMTPGGNPQAQLTTVAMSDKPGYLSFAYAPSRGMVYAADEGPIAARYGIPEGNYAITLHPPLEQTIAVYSVARGGGVRRIPCPDADNAIAVDDALGVLYVARRDGSVAVRAMQDGIPCATGENVGVGLQSISAMVVNPHNHAVYVFGAKGDVAPAADAFVRHRLVTVPSPVHISQSAVDPVAQRLYAVSGWNDGRNLWVWSLAKDGALQDEPRTFSDGLAAGSPTTPSSSIGLALDSTRRRLYVSNYPDINVGKGALLVYSLDQHGDPIGAPKVHAASLTFGGMYGYDGLTISADGQWLLATGSGEESIFALALDAHGNPTGGMKSWPTNGQRKSLLVPSTDPHTLLVGSYPSALDVVRLGDDGLPVNSVHSSWTIGGQSVDLPLLAVGDSSAWIPLDDGLKGADGVTFGRLAFTGSATPLKAACVKFEVAFGPGTRPVATVRANIAGNYAALFLPYYGLEDLSQLPALVQDASARYQRFVNYAQQNALSPEERPKQFVIADTVHLVDSSPLAMERGIEALAMVGKNSLYIGNYFPAAPPYLDPARVREVAQRNGITRAMYAIYNPEGYFDYLAETQARPFLDDWAKSWRQYVSVSGLQPEEVALFHLADEPGWYFPTTLNEATGRIRTADFAKTNLPMMSEAEITQRLEHFCQYVRSKGMTPQYFGKTSWAEIVPIGQGSATTLPAKRLFYWTMRYFPESFSRSLANATQALQRQFNSNILVGTNLNNWPGIFLRNAAGYKIANNIDAGPDAGMGAPDWFDLGRKNAVTTMWTEDWFPDNEAQRWSLYSDLLRCAARHGDLNFGGFLIGEQIHAMPDGGLYKIMAFTGHGAKAIDNWIFGPLQVVELSWSDMKASYASQAEGYRMLGRSERLLYPGKPRNGTVAIQLPTASQVWIDHRGEWNQNQLYMSELYGLHAALIHEQYTVDFIDDFDIEEGALEKYSYTTFYMTGANLSAKAQNAILAWVAKGGTLVMMPGAGVADEYDEALAILTAAAGATCGRVESIVTPEQDEILQHIPLVISFRNASFGVITDATAMPTMALTLTGAQVMATLPDGSPVVAEKRHGEGKVVSFGYWPGYTYWTSPDRNDPGRLPSGWAECTRAVISAPARLARTKKIVEMSQPLVEGVLLESDKGTAVTLLNWSGKPLTSLTVILPDAPAVLAAARDGKLKLSSVRQGALKYTIRGSNIVITLPLKTVDVLMFE